MNITISPVPRLEGQITPPGDKSISHRSVILNSFATGTAHVSNFSPGADCYSTVECLQAMGTQVAIEQGEDGPTGNLIVTGGGSQGFSEPKDVLNAGNSGTTMRLLSGLLAAQPFFSVLSGDASLRTRPMDRIVIPLSLMGARISGRGHNSLAPLAILGGDLRGITYAMPVASAQLKSAIMIAALFAQGETTIIEPAPSRDHTELMITAMGASVYKDGSAIIVKPMTSLRAVDVAVPADISGAAFWLVAGAIHPQSRVTVKDVGVNPSRTGILDVLRDMGAELYIEEKGERGGEPVADITVTSSPLRGVEIYGDMIPRVIDEIPVLAVAASVAKGVTRIRDASELRVKESDRIATTAQELNRLGAMIEELPDGMVIHGGRRLLGAECDSHGDHRLAMALGVAALAATGTTVVRGAEVAEISYPAFWKDLGKLTGTIPASPSTSR